MLERLQSLKTAGVPPPKLRLPLNDRSQFVHNGTDFTRELQGVADYSHVDLQLRDRHQYGSGLRVDSLEIIRIMTAGNDRGSYENS